MKEEKDIKKKWRKFSEKIPGKNKPIVIQTSNGSMFCLNSFNGSLTSYKKWIYQSEIAPETEERFFKLLEKYPTLDDKIQKGDMARKVSDDYYMVTKPANPDRSSTYNFTLNKSEVEDYPSFWKEVENKEEEDSDFKILSVRRKGKGTVFNTLIETRLSLQCMEFNINSVLRKKDDEVFELGDMTEQGKIVEIQRKKNGEIIYQSYKNGVLWFFLRTAIKRTPVLKTEDGKNIYPGDEYWYLNKDEYYISNRVADEKTSPKDKKVYFSSLKEAQDWFLI